MKSLIVVDSPKRWPLKIPGAEIVSSYEYLSNPEYAHGAGRKVFNLCRSFRYQAAGYYVSLLAEARGHRPLPSIAALQDLKLASVVRLVSHDIDELIQSSLKPIKSSTFELSVYFGRNVATRHNRLALAIFNAFPAPLLRARFERNGRWRLAGVRIIGVGDVPESHREFLIEQAGRYLRRAPRRGRSTPAFRYDLAILHDPHDPLPPSNPEALQKFVSAGEAMGISCDLIQKDAFGRIAEYDALFIRETTFVNHHTYRFARRASAEGLVVIDEPRSIVRCTNKVYLAEALGRHRIPTPRTVILSEDNAMAAAQSIGFPCVVKQPDSSFSLGVRRFDSEQQLAGALKGMFEQSDLLVAQEFVPTDFDWRVGVLDDKPLYACRYLMAPEHWQIVRHDEGGVQEGDHVTLDVKDVPEDVIRLGVRAASIMGDGLFGVDIKVVNGAPVVIEVNDNPNIDAGVEDLVLGDELYRTIMRRFLTRLEQRGA